MATQGILSKLFGTAAAKDMILPITLLRARAEEQADSFHSLSFPASGMQQNISRGIHPRKRAGMGDNFWQYRPYVSGDDAKNIDWRRSARSDQYFIREHEWQTSQHAWLWCDASASMMWRSADSLPSKYDHARLLTVATARLLEKSGERLGMLGTHDRTREGLYAYERLVEALDKQTINDPNADPDGSVGSTAMIEALPKPQVPTANAQLFLFSDFLMEDLGTLKEWLVAMNRQGVRGHLVHIIDPAEKSLPGMGRVRYQGMEGEGSHLVARVEDMRSDYQSLIQGFWQQLSEVARTCGWSLTRAYTDQPVVDSLAELMALADAAHASKRGGGQ